MAENGKGDATFTVVPIIRHLVAQASQCFLNAELLGEVCQAVDRDPADKFIVNREVEAIVKTGGTVKTTTVAPSIRQ